MLLMPDRATAIIDPFHELPTLSLICDVSDPITGESYTRDPRNVAQEGAAATSEQRHRGHGVLRPRGRVLHLRPRRPTTSRPTRAYYEVDSPEGYWNAGLGFGRGTRGAANLGYKTALAGRLLPGPAARTLSGDIRGADGADAGGAWASPIEVHHHEVGAARPGRDRHALHSRCCSMADTLHVLQVRGQATSRAKHGKNANFMPKPIFEENGSGMHVHQSLWKDGEHADVRRGRLRPAVARPRPHYVGGILEHAPSLLAFSAPTTN